jgi:rubredoxin
MGAGIVSAEHFEGSYLGDRSRVDATARLECKICWWIYDPAVGDPQWQIAPGTPFVELPASWSCPQCEGRADQFMAVGDR